MDIDHLLTDDNLDAYLDADEKFMFCQDLLGLSLILDGHNYTTRQVERLERAFEYMRRLPRAMNENGWTP